MAVQRLSKTLDEQRIIEYCVGSAFSRIVYPGIMQCLSITGWSEFGLLGTHVSPGATQQDITETLQMLWTGGGVNCTKWYIVGNFMEHAKYTKIGWSSPKKIGKAIKKGLSKEAAFFLYDTSTISSQYSFGINILAERDADGVAFSTGKAGPNPVYTRISAAFTKV